MTATDTRHRRPARQPIPASWRPLPEYVRGFVPAPCSRCCQIAWLPLGPGEALCVDCRIAEVVDRTAARALLGELIGEGDPGS